jgi:hypothetical protein
MVWASYLGVQLIPLMDVGSRVAQFTVARLQLYLFCWTKMPNDVRDRNGVEMPRGEKKEC